MKKYSIGFLLMSLLFVLAACGSSGSSGSSDKPDASSGDSGGNSVNIDFSLFSSENDAFSVVFREWAERVEEETEGRITFTPYYSGQLTSLFDTLDSVKNGTVGGGLLSAGAITGQVTDVSILEPEGVFDGEEHFKNFYNNTLDTMNDIFEEHGVHMTFWTLGSTEVLTMSPDEFLTDPKQYKGIKIRTAGKWQAAQMEAAGAVPVTMDPGELYLALQNKTVDSTMQTVSLAKAFKLYEVAPKLALRDVTANAVMYVINPDVWNEISEQDQETIMNISKEVALSSWRTLEEQQENDLQTMVDEGAEVHEMTEEEKAKLMKELTSIFPDIAESMGEKGMKLYDSIEESK
ncbi:TRAP transporter substrate-binding protein [Siminovitchia sediminis]|uniref:TRAP transporter substrate-binding protein n=1 Tax=Siminovitchia sediminis TaxID=1274353 RepID=A0ABW4KKS8_9BACI